MISCFFNSSDWSISILSVHLVICSVGCPLSHGSHVVVIFYRECPCSDWSISILSVHSVICSVGCPLSHGSHVVVIFYRECPRFWSFYFTIPVDVVRMKSYMNFLSDPAGLVIRVTINKLCFSPEWLVSGVVGMLLNGGGLGTGESNVSIVLLRAPSPSSFGFVLSLSLRNHCLFSILVDGSGYICYFK